MKRRPTSLITFLIGGIVSLGVAHAGTTILIGNNGSGTNLSIPDTFGDNIGGDITGVATTTGGGTPTVDLTWAASGGTNANTWQFHTWGGADSAAGGAFQLDGSSTNSVFSITFDAGTSHVFTLNGFNFVGDTNNDTYQYRVDLVQVGGATVYTSTTPLWTTDTSAVQEGAPSVDVNFTGVAGASYRLDLTRLNDDTGDAGSRVDIAIDNLSFSSTAVPEPSTSLLLGMAGLGLLVRRKRR
ncbi:PEP-CTERM sorting domain-containing protein [Rubritalea tangerina]|uniref:PEP-CTERM sorting domain-containing protein n=1 Tax=Rubritalea tangerina TaxID=430798 RepID=A0ABW4ZD55_9BACT